MYPAVFSRRATARPSPPLLPLPHRMATRPARSSGTRSRSARAMARAALSMSASDGMPISSMAIRSASRMSLAK